MALIWLVDDAELAGGDGFMTSFLRDELGHRVHSCRTAGELLSKIDDLPRPDAVVLDLVLVGAPNGFQLGEEILKRRRDLSVRKFFFITGHNEARQMRSALFRESCLLSKGQWTLEQFESALGEAIGAGGDISSAQ